MRKAHNIRFIVAIMNNINITLLLVLILKCNAQVQYAYCIQYYPTNDVKCIDLESVIWLNLKNDEKNHSYQTLQLRTHFIDQINTNFCTWT